MGTQPPNRAHHLHKYHYFQPPSRTVPTVTGILQCLAEEESILTMRLSVSIVPLSPFCQSGMCMTLDDIAKTTDENLTSENWELILNCCDKVQEEGQDGYGFFELVIIQPSWTPTYHHPHSARNVISAIQKRLAHRNPNVQLYALSLAESLSKNVGIEIHREIASKAFTQVLEKLITDRVCG